MLTTKLFSNETTKTFQFTVYPNTRVHVMQGSPLVWVCLADVIVGVVEEAITSSAVVEGLWMCRTHLLRDEQVLYTNFRVEKFS